MAPGKRERRADRHYNNGYCYIRLFRDVLKNKCNVAETKRIFGKFPRLRDVVLQLAKVADADCYVHDLHYTGYDMYHVSDDNLILLSSLIVRHMFSTALIGGYDVNDDKALRQSEFARRLGGLAAIGSKDIKELLSTAASVHVNKQLADDSSPLMDYIQTSAYEAVKCRRITLPYAMSSLELARLQEEHPEYTLVNNGGKHHCHAVAGNSRICSMEVLLDMVGYKKHMPPVYGEDVCVVDIGGDYVCHVKNNRLNVHCDTPVLTPRDSARETTRRAALTSLLAQKKINRNTFDGLTGARIPCKQRCMDRAEHCTVTCTYVIVNHAQYDISHEDFAKALDNHKPRIAVSAMHFDPRIFTQDSFVNEDLKVRVVIDRTSKEPRIHFDFTGDSSFSYSHNYNDYVKTVTATHLVTPSGRCYVVERAGTRGPTLYLRYVYCEVQPEISRDSFRFNFWLNLKDDTLVVSTWQYQTGYYRDSKFVQFGEKEDCGRFLRKHIEVSRKLYELIMANCIRASERSFNLTEMLSAAISFNTRLTINGQDVRTDRDRLDTESLVALVVACYCIAYVVRYGAGRTIECFVNQEKSKREKNKLSFFALCGHAVDALFSSDVVKRKWNSFMDFLSAQKEKKDMTFSITASVRAVTVEEHVAIIAGYDHHVGEAVLRTDSEEIDLLDVRNVLELKYVDGKLIGKPRQVEPSSPVVGDVTSGKHQAETGQSVVAARPPPSVISNSTIVRTDRQSNVAKKKLTNRVVRAMSHISDHAPLSERAHEALKELRRESKDDCGSLHTVRMLGDGRCAYYAMLHCIGLTGTAQDVVALRRILLDSCPAELLDVNENLSLDDFNDKSAWGTTDNFGLFSRLVDSRLCVHVVTDTGDLKTTAYSMHTDAANGVMHVKWIATGPGHVDMYEGDDFSKGTEGRAERFAEQALELIWNLKGEGKVFYDTSSRLPPHQFLNRSGLKLMSILVTYQNYLVTEQPVLDLCGAPGGFATVLTQVNADFDTVSGPLIEYDASVQGNRLEVDILAQDALEKIPDRRYALVVADGADETSYMDPSILEAEIKIVRARLVPGGNCVIKVSNVFAHKAVYQQFIEQFATVHYVKPDFSLVGNTEVYLVCLGFGQQHKHTTGEQQVRTLILRGILTYYNAMVDGKDMSDVKTTQYLIDVLVAGLSTQQWRPGTLCAGGVLLSKPVVAEEIPLMDIGGSDDGSVSSNFELRSDTESVAQCEITAAEEVSSAVDGVRGISASCELVTADEVSISDAGESDILPTFDNLRLRFVESGSGEDVPELESTDDSVTQDEPYVPVGKLISLAGSSRSSPVLVDAPVGGLTVPATSTQGNLVISGVEKRLVKVPDYTTDESGDECSLLEEEVVSNDLLDRYVQQQKPIANCEEGEPTVVDKVRKFFGKQPRKCKRVTVAKEQRYGSITERSVTAVGRTADGGVINSYSKHERVHKIVRNIETSSHVACRHVGTDMNGVEFDGTTKLDIVARKPSVRTRTIGVGVSFDSSERRSSYSSDSGVSSGPVSGEEEEVGDNRKTKSEVLVREPLEQVERAVRSEPVIASPVQFVVKKPVSECRLAEKLDGIERVNMPTNEPIRATALFTAVKHLKQDVLFSYAWRERKHYKLSKCFKHLTGRSHFRPDEFEAMSVVTRLGEGTVVYELKVVDVYVFLIKLERCTLIETAVTDCLKRTAEIITGTRMRVSLDVFACKEYAFDTFGLMEFSNANRHLVLVLYLHAQYQKGKVFGSPYLYPDDKKFEMFPLLSDEDLGMVRRPSFYDDDVLEHRFRNSMIEYLHTSLFVDKVAAVEMRKHFDSAIRSGDHPSASKLEKLASKGYFFYDNVKKCVLSGPHDDYGWAFTVEGGVSTFCRYMEDDKMYDSKSRYQMRCRATKVMLAEEIAFQLRKVDIGSVKIPKITWVNGPPGCGKTEFALRTHKRPTKTDAGDLILTVTKESCESLRKRVSPTVEARFLNVNYRTVASVLCNGVKAAGYDKVIVDEALMVHAGQLAYVAELTKAKELVIIGDIHQIPYIDRDHVTKIQYANPDRFCSVTQTLRRTHRCPVDVTFLLSCKYEGFYSVSTVVHSLKRERYSGRGVAKEEGVVYLVLFQSDKSELQRQGYETSGSRVLTVHEAQGQTFAHVRYVRTSHKPLKLYESEGHAIVAVSRHTQSFVYYTDVDDLVVNWMNRVAGKSQAELIRWNDERKLANGEQLVAGYVAPPLVIFRPEVNNYAGPEATEAMRAIGARYHNPNIPEELFPEYTVCDLPLTVVRPPKDADIGYVQSWYDGVITTNAENDVTQDQLIYESSDLTIPIYDTLRIDPLKPGYRQKKYSKMTPVLKTIMPANLVQSQVTRGRQHGKRECKPALGSHRLFRI